ncbi:MAG TPA: L-seryl-tRNA(Sec) selenium transferase [Candidatus Acidoferrum sp.]|nr:L-seryl-tRNA(Sec) selenium transferase [Candidatus Acidoferrum sp.]
MEHNAKRSLDADKAALLRQIPSVDELLRQPRLAKLAGRIPRELLVEVAREVLAGVRDEISGKSGISVIPVVPTDLEDVIAREVERILSRTLQPVINATGVILHTNLGRAPLAPAVLEEFRQTAIHYSNLEYDLEAGARGKRDLHTSESLARLTGAEDAIVVNNCAAAILVVLAALAKDGEVLVSRGELIEIGDGFRIPEVMEQSGAILREVGTTNRTHIADYENAITDKTRLLLRVHPSNFQMSGFTDKPSVEELVELSKRSGLPLVEDLGSGCLVDLTPYGIDEPTVRQSIEAGMALVTFSGDKLLGGPQAGIIAGKKDFVRRVRRHPLFRALRVDKLIIAALEVTLGSYQRGALDEIPAIAMIRATRQEIERRCRHFIRDLTASLSMQDLDIEIIDGESLAGGGSTPAQSLPTKLIRIRSSRRSASQLEQRLRRGSATSVICRVEDDSVVLDLRTVFAEQEAVLGEALVAALR